MPIIQVNEQSLFDDVVNRKGLVLLTCIDVKHKQWAVLQAAIHELTLLYGFAMRFCLLNTVNNSLLQKKLEIETIPAFFLMRDGHIIDERDGFMAQNELASFLEDHL